MAEEKYSPIAPVNIGVGKDTINDFARKYNLEIEKVYDVLNKTSVKKVNFTSTSVYWKSTGSGYTLTVPHNNNIIFAVYRVETSTQATQVLTGITIKANNVVIESVSKFDGYLLVGALNEDIGIGSNLTDDVKEYLEDKIEQAEELVQEIKDYSSEVAAAVMAELYAGQAASSATSASASASSATVSASTATTQAAIATAQAELLEDIYEAAVNSGRVQVPAIDDSLVTKNAAAESYATGVAIGSVKAGLIAGQTEQTTLAGCWEQGRYSQAQVSPTKISSVYGIRLPNGIRFKEGAYKVKVANNFALGMHYELNDDTVHYQLLKGETEVFLTPDILYYVYIYNTTQTTQITVSQINSIVSFERIDYHYPSALNGDVTSQLHFVKDSVIGSANIILHKNDTTECVSIPVPMPKKINVGSKRTASVDVSTIGGYRVHIFTKNNNGGYSLVHSLPSSSTNLEKYYERPNDNYEYYYSVYLSKYADRNFFRVNAGVDDTYIGKLPNLCQGNCTFNSTDNTIKIEAGYHTSGYSVFRHRVSIFRLSDVKSVRCNPSYSLKAVVYKKTSTGYVAQDYVFGTVNSSYPAYYQSGVGYIDFSKYNYEGYVRLAISVSNAETGFNFYGILADEQNVKNNVFVEYYNGVTIERGKAVSNVIVDNIKTLSNLVIPSTPNFKYVSPLSEDRTTTGSSVPAMTNATIGWYAGGFNGLMPLVHTSWLSYLTSAANKWSRYYNARYNPSDTTDTNIINQYGSRCNGIVCYLYGWHENYRCGVFDFDCYEDGAFKTEKFTLIRKWNWEDIKIGDSIAWTDTVDAEGEVQTGSHIITVTDVVYINGGLHSVDCIEFYPPYTRYRTIFFDNGQPNADIAKDFSVAETTNAIKVILRPNPKYVKHIEDVFDLTLPTYKEQKYIMCDKGLDSVYVINNGNTREGTVYSKCAITVTDSASTYINRVITDDDGNTVRQDQIQLANIPVLMTESGERLFDFTNYITTGGLYTLSLNNHNATDYFTRFYVADTAGIDSVKSTDSTKYTLTSPNYEALDVRLIYGTGDQKRYWVTVANDKIVKNGNNYEIACEPYIENSSNEKFNINYAYWVVKTDYGTFSLVKWQGTILASPYAMVL